MCVAVYDALTGQIVRKLSKHRACVRDVNWHPYEHKIMSTSVSISSLSSNTACHKWLREKLLQWDGKIGQWTYKWAEDEPIIPEDSDSDSDSETQLRRSHRLRNQRRSGRRIVML